jgi:hypothetical protein
MNTRPQNGSSGAGAALMGNHKPSRSRRLKHGVVAVLMALSALWGVFALGAPGAASASTFTCSGTSPAYLLGGDMAVSSHHGISFKASSTEPYWQDEYWVSGWYDANNNECSGDVVPQGGLVSKTNVSATLHVKVDSGNVRTGWDLWFTASGNDQTPAEMESHGTTREVLIDNGDVSLLSSGWGRACEVYGGREDCWQRIYIKEGTFNNLDLSRIIRGYVSGNLRWNSIDAGGETGWGSFTVTSYNLKVS